MSRLDTALSAIEAALQDLQEAVGHKQAEPTVTSEPTAEEGASLPSLSSDEVAAMRAELHDAMDIVKQMQQSDAQLTEGDAS